MRCLVAFVVLLKVCEGQNLNVFEQPIVNSLELDGDGGRTTGVPLNTIDSAPGSSGQTHQHTTCSTSEGRDGICTVGQCNKVPPGHKLVECPTPSGAAKAVCCPKDARKGTSHKNHPSCGRATGMTRIVGGKVSKAGRHPWQAGVMVGGPTRNDASLICGGTVINARFIATAAHCVFSGNDLRNASDFLVLVGAFDQYKDGHTVKVVKVIPHASYRVGVRYYDIALLKLERDLKFNNPLLRPACLPGPEVDKKPYTGSMITTTGWGSTNNENEKTNKMREVTMPIIDNNRCSSEYYFLADQSYAFPDGMRREQFCAGDEPQGGKDSCQGDSGGPAVMTIDQRVVLFGIVSFGYKCAQPDYAGVYTRVSSYLKWIGTNVENNYN